MGLKARPKAGPLLKIGKGAADSEIIQRINQSLFLFSRSRPRIVFRKGAKHQGLLPECLDAQSLVPGASYLLVEELSNRILGYVRGVRYRTIKRRDAPESGRVYSLYRMPSA